MKGWLIFCTLSALFGLLSAFEGMWAILLFLLYILGILFLKKVPINSVLLYVLVFCFYYFIGNYTEIHNKSVLMPDSSQFAIQFSDEVKIDGNKLTAVVIETFSEEKLLLTYKIPSELEKKQLQSRTLIKNKCVVKGNLLSPAEARNPNGFNYLNYLNQNHIYWMLNITHFDTNDCKFEKLTFVDRIKLLREKGTSLIEKNFSKETAPLAAALIFGERELLSNETSSAYQKLGVIHLISISGLHVALLVGMVFYLGMRIGIVRENLTLVIITFLPMYAILTGGSPSVNRSVIMTMILLLSTQIRQSAKFSSINGLCLSFLLLVIMNPLSIYNIGFQLSYIVTFSLLLSLEIISKYSSSLSKMVVTSYISTLSSLPFLLFHFFEAPLLSIIANIFFIPLYSFIILPGLILLFILQLISNEFFLLFSYILSFIIGKSDQIAIFFSSFQWARVIPGKPSIFYLCLYSISIMISFYFWEKDVKKTIFFILPWMVLGAHLFIPSSEGEITFINVGQGDSILIELPKNQGNFLIDTGGNMVFQEDKWKQKKNNYDVGKHILVPFLKSKGIGKLDMLILTHGDMDHIGGALSLLEEIKVKQIIFPSIVEKKSHFEEEIMSIAKKKQIKVIYVYEGVGWKVNNNDFHVLSPRKGFKGEKNDGSIVIYAKVGGAYWLFTGDLGREGEYEIIKKYPNLKVDVLKVGHHGSRTSTSEDFIQHFRPKYSIISVGEKNGFGHPHSEVLNILDEGGSKIYRTDIHGGISYIFKENRGTFYPSFHMMK